MKEEYKKILQKYRSRVKKAQDNILRENAHLLNLGKRYDYIVNCNKLQALDYADTQLGHVLSQTSNDDTGENS